MPSTSSLIAPPVSPRATCASITVMPTTARCCRHTNPLSRARGRRALTATQSCSMGPNFGFIRLTLTLMLTLTLTLAALTLTPSPVQTPLAERRHGRERPCCSGTQTTGAFAAPTFAQPGGSSSVPQLELWPTHWGTLWWWRLQTNRCQRCDADRAVAVIAAQGCRCAAHHVLHAAAILTSAVSTLLSPSPSAPRHASPPAFCPCLLPGDPAAAERRRRRVPGHGGDAGRPPGAVHAAASCCRGHNGAIGVSCGGAIGGGTT